MRDILPHAIETILVSAIVPSREPLPALANPAPTTLHEEDLFFLFILATLATPSHGPEDDATNASPASTSYIWCVLGVPRLASHSQIPHFYP
jgi:hypothetical protein